MSGQGLGGIGFKPPGHVFEVELPVRGAHGLFVFVRPFHQFVINHRVGKLPVALPQQRPLRTGPQNHVRRFHIHHPIPFLPQFVRDQAGGAGEKLRARAALQLELVGRFNRVQPFDPAKQQHVLPEDVDFDTRV